MYVHKKENSVLNFLYNQTLFVILMRSVKFHNSRGLLPIMSISLLINVSAWLGLERFKRHFKGLQL